MTINSELGVHLTPIDVQRAEEFHEKHAHKSGYDADAWCPIAMAWRRATGHKAWVTGGGICDRETGVLHPLPSWAFTFVEGWK